MKFDIIVVTSTGEFDEVPASPWCMLVIKLWITLNSIKTNEEPQNFRLSRSLVTEEVDGSKALKHSLVKLP